MAKYQNQLQDPHHPESTINDLVDQFGDTGVEEGEFPQARDDDYDPAFVSSKQPPRDHPQRVRKPSRRVLENVIHHDEIPFDDPEVFVNNTFVIMPNEPTTFAEAMAHGNPSKRPWSQSIIERLGANGSTKSSAMVPTKPAGLSKDLRK
jgi:hypothetical protein